MVRLRWGLPHVRRGDADRDRGNWIDAVVAYRRGLEWMPWRSDLLVQIGNCLKEYGDFAGAAAAYQGVAAGPSRLEAQKQLSDLHRRSGMVPLPFDIAVDPAAAPVLPDGALPAQVAAHMLPNRLRIGAPLDRRWLGTLGQASGPAARMRGNAYATIKLQQVGTLALERGGAREPLLAGVIAVRGRVLSLGRLAAVEIRLGQGAAARTIATVPVTEADVDGPLRLSVFNAWIDSTALPPGRDWLSVRAGERIPEAGLFVNVVAIDTDHPALATSSSLVPSPPPGVAPDAGVVALPAIPRPARRSLFETPIRSVLAVRADQLGDVAATLPALARLRALLPDARITALVQPAVEAVVAASGVVDAVLTLELHYDAVSEQRRLAPEEERRLRGSLPRVDLAIDLCPGGETRPLLLLCEADYLVGCDPDRFTFLDFGVTTRSRDKVNGLDKLSHAAHVLTLVEALGVAMRSTRGCVARAAGGTAVRDLGLVPGGYAVLHTGARHAINQWPADNFIQLALRILDATPLSVVLFADGDPPAELGRFGDRLRHLRMLPADAFDQVVSSARVMVGNDSGPKHLAAARGVPTVSLHVGRLNWNEWGQDGEGVVLAKRVPCAGCGLNDIQLCGRDAVCLRSITVKDVFDAMGPYLAPRTTR